MKIPDEGLTLIVLANIDGLTRPFPLGDGDVMTSLVALAFYKEFILVPRCDHPFPTIDLSGNSAAVMKLISQLQDESVRDLLVRELLGQRRVAIPWINYKIKP